jgi:hypothetical protein
MAGVEKCPECGVPYHITSEHNWLNNGAIVQSRERRTRMVFIECENLDPLFDGIENLIGMPIGRAVTAAKRKAVRTYLGNLMPDMTKELLRKRQLDWKPVNDGFRAIGRIFGFGRYELVDYRHEQDVDDYVVETISEPYSLPLACGTMAGAFEILYGCELGVKYRKRSRDLYELTCYVSSHPKEFKGRLRFNLADLKDGDIDLKRCASCGGPEALSSYKWYPERGVIEGRTTGKRMIMTGMELEAIFGELEKELGDAIPRAVIEAQRRFVRTGFYDIEGIGKMGMQDQLALRGLGNLQELKSDKKSLYIRIENAFLHLMVVGLVQGLYEQTWDTNSLVEWELSGENVLEVEVYPLATGMESVEFA